MSHFVHILANKPHGTIYLGSARDLRQRVEQHRSGVVAGHAQKYRIKTHVCFEKHEQAVEALHRDRRMKRWRQAWKDELIETANPDWHDVSSDIPD